jgi:hypothetical protein
VYFDDILNIIAGRAGSSSSNSSSSSSKSNMAEEAAAGDTPDQQQDAEQKQQQQAPAAMPLLDAWATAQMQAGFGAEALTNQLTLQSEALQQQLREQLALDVSPRRLSQNAPLSLNAAPAATAPAAATRAPAAASSSSSTKLSSSSSSSSSSFTTAAPAKPAAPAASAAAAPRKPRVMCTSADLLENYIFTRSAYSNPLQAPLALHCPGSKAYQLISCMRMPSLGETK